MAFGVFRSSDTPEPPKLESPRQPGTFSGVVDPFCSIRHYVYHNLGWRSIYRDLANLINRRFRLNIVDLRIVLSDYANLNPTTAGESWQIFLELHRNRDCSAESNAYIEYRTAESMRPV